MIGLDYRRAIFQSNDDEDDEEDEIERGGVHSQRTQNQVERWIEYEQRTPETRNVREHGEGDKQLERNGSLRNIFQKSGSLRLSRHGPKKDEDDSDRSVSSEKKGSLRNLLQRSNSIRLSRRSLYSRDGDADGDGSGSDSEMSNSSSSLNMGSFFLSWGNTSVSADLTMSIASFAASMSSLQSSKDANMEPEGHVTKLLRQLQERIDSRKERQKYYQNHIDKCLQLACARYETGSPNAASLVSMRRVDRLRDAQNRVREVQSKLQELHIELDTALDEAKLMAGEGESVPVQVDLEDIRSRARKAEEEAQNREAPKICNDTLLEELKRLVPEIQAKRLQDQKKRQHGRKTWQKSKNNNTVETP